MLKPRRSLVLKEATGLLFVADQFRVRVSEALTKGASPLIQDPKALHSYIRRMEDHLDQVKTLIQYKRPL
jgi:hypothetical protein